MRTPAGSSGPRASSSCAAASGATCVGSPTRAAAGQSGLRTGLLTYGGAYAAIPFLRRDAVVQGNWMTDGQFLGASALGGVLPAPLIIFGTKVTVEFKDPKVGLERVIARFLMPA